MSTTDSIEPADAGRAEQKRSISVGRATWIMAASGVAAVSTFLVTVLAARVLSVEANKEFLVFWGLMFAVFGIVAGTQTESTRAIAAGRRLDEAGYHLESNRASAVKVALVIGVIAGFVILGTAPLWAPRMTPSAGLLPVLCVAIGAFAYAGEMAMSGAFAGSSSWGHYSLLMGGEALLRILLIGVVAITVGNLAGFELASAVPAFTWCIFLLVPAGRRMVRARADVAVWKLAKFNIQAMISSAAWAILVTGFATMLELTSKGVDAAELATVILVVTLTRSPIMIPLQAFQGVLITSIAGAENRNRIGVVAKILAALTGGGALLAVVAALIGPWLTKAIFGEAYHPTSWLVGMLTLAATAMAALVFTGATTVALGRHRDYAAGWVLAAIIAFLLLFALPFGVGTRAVIALLVAPVCGVLVHLLAILRSDSQAAQG